MDRKELEREGWTKRGVYDEPRLTEVCNMYIELGFEVVVLPYEPSLEDSCNICLNEMENFERYKVVYTKKMDR